MALVGLSTTVVSFDVEAKRLGSGRPAGMQRQAPAKAPDATPAKPGQPTNANAPTQGAAPAAAGAAAGAAGKRSWMGPIAGIAAGLGIAALMSHLGMGEAFGNFLTMALLAVVAVIAIRFLMNRFRQNNGGGAARGNGPQLAGAGAPWPAQGNNQASQPRPADVLSPMQREAQQAFSPAAPVTGAVGGASVSSTPEGFDAAGFERIAKMIFIRLQAANDESNVDDLRKFTTPELFASLRLDLQERGQAAQQTDVMQLEAQLVETTQENGQWIASVRFSGLIREAADQGAEQFNELWHLVKPVDGDREWAIAGITPLEA